MTQRAWVRKRQQAERRGRVAEFIAALWLIGKGYRILGQRLRTPYGEVDLAAWKSGVLVIVEVKSRKTLLAGTEAIGLQSRTRIMRAAETLAGRWRLTKAPIRFDLMVIGAGFLPKHERGAWWSDRGAA